MSGENKNNPYNLYHYDHPFFQQNPSLEDHPNTTNNFYSSQAEYGSNNNIPSHDTNYMMNFNDFLHGGGSVGSSMADYGQNSSSIVSRGFDMLSSSSADHPHLISGVVPMAGELLATSEENRNSSLPVQHSSVSSSSTEVVGEEDSGKSKVDDEDDDNKSKKVTNKQKKKAEKRVKEPRFAFMTKTEIDQLEDGYRWRKYGQKAVKNSPYPRSYYRCTAQKCIVKKRVERSFEDPSTVITTYEGQHNHHCPTTLRGNAAAMLPANAALFGSSGVHNHDFPQHLLPSNNNSQNNYSNFQISSPSNPHTHYSQHLPDFGLLQDLIIDPSSRKREDYHNP